MFLESIGLALDAARYHEARALEFARPQQDGSYTEAQRRAVIAHLRAYYWELWAIWDYILRNANSQQVQPLRERDVNTGLVEVIRERNPGYQFLPDITAIRDSPWRHRIQQIRHSA